MAVSCDLMLINNPKIEHEENLDSDTFIFADLGPSRSGQEEFSTHSLEKLNELAKDRFSHDKRLLKILLERNLGGKTLAEVGSNHGLTRERARQLESSAIEILRQLKTEAEFKKILNEHLAGMFSGFEIVGEKFFENKYLNHEFCGFGRDVSPIEFLELLGVIKRLSIIGVPIVLISSELPCDLPRYLGPLEKVQRHFESLVGISSEGTGAGADDLLEDKIHWLSLRAEGSAIWACEGELWHKKFPALFLNAKIFGDYRVHAEAWVQVKRNYQQADSNVTVSQGRILDVLIQESKKLEEKFSVYRNICRNSQQVLAFALTDAANYLGLTVEDLRNCAPRAIYRVLQDNTETRDDSTNQWSRAICLDALRQASLYAFPLTAHEYTHLIQIGAVAGPSLPRLTQIFGSWLEACDEAGVEGGTAIRDYDSTWTNKQLREILQKFLSLGIKISDSSQAYDEWAAKQGGDFPSSQTLRNRLGGAWLKVRADSYRILISEEI